MLSQLLSVILIINEIVASNIDGNMSPATNFDTWIELYNPGEQAVSLYGMYLSDDPDNLQKWKMPLTVGTVPAKGFKVVWMGSNHIKPQQAPFSLNGDGGMVFLSDKDGNVLDSQDYPEALSRTSWARTADGAGQWGWTDKATPNATNTTATFCSERLEAPVVEPGSTFFSSSVTVRVTIPEGCTLRYTTDGSLPTLTNGSTSTTGVFTRTGTNDMRFRLYRDGYLPSVPVTRSYVKTAYTSTIPIITIVGDNRYFNDNTWGIAVRGTNGRTGNGQSTPCNWNMDWDRPVNFSMILPDGQMAFNQDVNICVSGGWSRPNEPKSYKLKAAKEFDQMNNLSYRFFPQKPYLRNKALLLRNGGNDGFCRFLDPAVQTIIQRSGIDIDVQSYVPVFEYVNGQFKGVLNLREPNNRKFVAANFGYDDDRIDMFEMSADSNVYMMVGTMDALERIYELGAQAVNASAYEELKTLLDIDEFINYMAMQFYIGSTDWPHNNIKGYRKWDGGRYRFVTFDLDFVFSTSDSFNFFKNDQWHTFHEIYDTHQQLRAEIKLVTLFLNLLNNNDFRKKFIDTFSIMGGSVFEAKRCEAIINELADFVRPMMQVDGKNPNDAANKLINGFNSRMNTMMTRIQQFDPMQLKSAKKLNVKFESDAPHARAFINNVEVPYASFNGQVFAPVTLRVEAPGGYRFAGWVSKEVTDKELFPMNVIWRYYDGGSLQGQNWTANDYNDSQWKQGPAPLGYKMQGTATTISYGSNSEQKYPTYYFRKTVTLSEDLNPEALLRLNYQVDDGMVVYINGTEVGRVNMPEGNVNYNTYSSTYAADDPLTGTLLLSPSLLKKGRNIIAVEVHNTSATSGDIFWAAELICSNPKGTELNYVSYSPELTLDTKDLLNVVAHFEPLTDEQRQQQHITPVRINEVSAANDKAVNDHWKRNDWVELFNTTDHDIDLEGYYLSDDAAKPRKYVITKGESTASTIIPAHGFITIWCDKLEQKSQLHASFKLSDGGGVVLLTDKDGAWTDIISYSQHLGDESVGRYPDGSDRVMLLTISTIEAPNLLTSYVSEVDQSDVLGIDKVEMDLASDLIVRSLKGELIVRSQQAQSGEARVITTGGQTLMVTSLRFSGGKASVDTARLPAGCYVAHITDDRGRSAACKFIVQ